MSLGQNRSLFIGTVPVADRIDAKVLQMWSGKEIAAGTFYRTGFETILFNRDRNFALECVITSTLSWDKELLIAGTNKSNLEAENLAHRHGVNYTSFSVENSEMADLDAFFGFKPSITHLLINIENYTSLTDQWINAFLHLVEKHRLVLIINCLSDIVGLNDRFHGAIDFMVGEYEVDTKHSFVVARRSKLVQTEGNSRSFALDLHAFWQWSLRNRNPIIEPMCV